MNYVILAVIGLGWLVLLLPAAFGRIEGEDEHERL
jgi:hypothetical protein